MYLRLLTSLLVLLPTVALAFSEPERGSKKRQKILDSARAVAEWSLGEDIEFVVEHLRISGRVAYASLQPQRPGGGVIQPAETPLGDRDPWFAEEAYAPIDMDVLFRRSGAMWVPIEYSFGATEAWWDDPLYCSEWGRVLPEWCAPQ